MDTRICCAYGSTLGLISGSGRVPDPPVRGMEDRHIEGVVERGGSASWKRAEFFTA